MQEWRTDKEEKSNLKEITEKGIMRIIDET